MEAHCVVSSKVPILISSAGGTTSRRALNVAPPGLKPLCQCY